MSPDQATRARSENALKLAAQKEAVATQHAPAFQAGAARRTPERPASDRLPVSEHGTVWIWRVVDARDRDTTDRGEGPGLRVCVTGASRAHGAIEPACRGLEKAR